MSDAYRLLPATVIERELAERSFHHFIRFAWPSIEPGRFVDGWHLQALAEHLEAVARGDIRRLMINIPPRHMKSLSLAAWRAWIWAQNRDRAHAAGGPQAPHMGPHVRFLSASYGQDLATRDNVRARRILQSRWYRGHWGERVRLVGDVNRRTRFETDAGGYSIATSVDGALTGEGGDIVIVDDPHNVREGESEKKRRAVIDWWDEALSTRLNDPKTGAYVIIMQRVRRSGSVVKETVTLVSASRFRSI